MTGCATIIDAINPDKMNYANTPIHLRPNA